MSLKTLAPRSSTSTTWNYLASKEVLHNAFSNFWAENYFRSSLKFFNQNYLFQIVSTSSTRKATLLITKLPCFLETLTCAYNDEPSMHTEMSFLVSNKPVRVIPPGAFPSIVRLSHQRRCYVPPAARWPSYLVSAHSSAPDKLVSFSYFTLTAPPVFTFRRRGGPVVRAELPEQRGLKIFRFGGFRWRRLEKMWRRLSLFMLLLDVLFTEFLKFRRLLMNTRLVMSNICLIIIIFFDIDSCVPLRTTWLHFFKYLLSGRSGVFEDNGMRYYKDLNPLNSGEPQEFTWEAW